MKIDISKTGAIIEITITGSADDCVVTIKANNCTVITETENESKELQSDTDLVPSYKYDTDPELFMDLDNSYVPSYRMYDTNPVLFLDLYDRYMNGELSAPDVADLLGCSAATFNNMVQYYRKKENIHDNKLRTNNKNLAIYNIYDKKPEEFLKVYTRYMNDELTRPEAADLLSCSVSTFNNMISYYRHKENIHEVKRGGKKYKNLTKYTIYDEKPEEFLEVYNKFTNKEIYSKEAARLLGVSVSTFYRSIRYYESKTGIENFG